MNTGIEFRLRSFLQAFKFLIVEVEQFNRNERFERGELFNGFGVLNHQRNAFGFFVNHLGIIHVSSVDGIGILNDGLICNNRFLLTLS